MTCRFKFNDFGQLSFRCKIMGTRVHFLETKNYFFGKYNSLHIIENVYGNKVNIDFESEMTFIPSFKLDAIICNRNSERSLIKLYRFMIKVYLYIL